MNKDDNLNDENMVEKCCFCVGGATLGYQQKMGKVSSNLQGCFQPLALPKTDVEFAA